MEQLVQAFLPIIVILFVVVGILSALVSTAAKTNEQMGNNREMSAYDRMLAEARARAASQREGGAAPPASGQKARLIAAPASPASQPAAQAGSRLQVKRRDNAPPQAPRLREHHLEGMIGAPRDLSKVDDRNIDSLVKAQQMQSKVRAPDPSASTARVQPASSFQNANQRPQQQRSNLEQAAPTHARTLVDTSAESNLTSSPPRSALDLERIANNLTPLQRILVLGQILQSRAGEQRGSWERF